MKCSVRYTWKKTTAEDINKSIKLLCVTTKMTYFFIRSSQNNLTKIVRNCNKLKQLLLKKAFSSYSQIPLSILQMRPFHWLGSEKHWPVTVTSRAVVSYPHLQHCEVCVMLHTLLLIIIIYSISSLDTYTISKVKAKINGFQMVLNWTKLVTVVLVDSNPLLSCRFPPHCSIHQLG